MPSLFDYFQLTLIHGPNIAGSYAILFFTAWALLSPPDTFTTGCYFCFGSISSFLLELLTVYTVILYTYISVHIVYIILKALYTYMLRVTDKYTNPIKFTYPVNTITY